MPVLTVTKDLDIFKKECGVNLSRYFIFYFLRVKDLKKLKTWWDNLPPIHRYAIIVIGISYFFVVCITVLLTRYRENIATLEGFFNANNIESLAVSLWASILFFTVIGLATLLISIKRPENDIIENRVWYLFSSRNATDEARKYVVQRIHKFAAFASKGSIKFTIREFNEQINAYKIDVHDTYFLKNMLPYEDYVDEKSELEVWGDKIDQPPKNELAGLSMARITKNDIPEDLINEPVTISVKNGKYLRDDLCLRIDASGEATYEYKYWVWALAGECIVSSVNRYSENIKVTAQNNIENMIVPCETTPENGGIALDIHPKGTSIDLAEKATITPETPFQVRFLAPKVNIQGEAPLQ
jgi:hypothetical protein